MLDGEKVKLSPLQTEVDLPKCIVCGGFLRPRFNGLVASETGELFSVYFCPRCLFGQTVPQPSSLSVYYGEYQGGPSTDFCTKRRLRFVQSVVRHSDNEVLLDIGCGDGHFLKAASKRGWKVAGTDLNPQAAAAAGLEVSSSLSGVERLAPFRCITLWHSLEHLRNPRESLLELVRLLSPCGALIVAVPNAQGWQARLFGPNWIHLDVPRHLFHFGPSALKRLLGGAGLEVIRTWHHEFEYDVFGWSVSVINSMRSRKFGPLTSRMEKLTPRTAMDLAILMAFSVMAIPPVVVGTLAGYGGTLVMAARKRQP